jgi:CRISPR system Cascade subunit CasE
MAVYLSRLFLDNRNRQVRRDLADCHQLHRTILQAFGDVPNGTTARTYFDLLFRAEAIADRPELTRLLVQSTTAPDWSHIKQGYLGEAPDNTANPSQRTLDADYKRITVGMPLIFRLRANPTKRISDRTPGRTDPLVGKRVELLREADQIEWIQRKGQIHGFRVLETYTSPDVPDVRITRGEKTHGRKPGKYLSFGAITFNGRLEVTDADGFRAALIQGIGSGRAFGFGLLSIAEIR